MIHERDITDVLRTIDDPEMPISIVDLGIVEDVQVDEDGRTSIVILPTFIGCPALDMIRDEIEKRVSAMEGVQSVEVSFVNDPPWSVDRMTDAGRESLREHGVTVPERGSPAGLTTLTTSVIDCPFCGSTKTHLESPFGPTRCRMIYYCDDCRNSFERIKKV